jgi:hypothetical protein
MRYSIIFLIAFLITLVSSAAQGVPLDRALLVAAKTLAPPYAPPDKAEAAAIQRDEFLPKLATALANTADEASCSGAFAKDGCKRAWPGTADEHAALALTLGWWESRLDPRIQNGECEIYGPKPTQRECDGALYPNGAVPPWERGIRKQSRWGTVVFHSTTLFQIQGLKDERIKQVVGLELENLIEASREQSRVMSSHRRACYARDWVLCTINAYAGTITFKQAPLRAATYRKVLTKVRAELAKKDDEKNS